jgi:hypothetical protein
VRVGANIEAVRELTGHGDLETTAGDLHAVAADKVAVIDAVTGNWRATPTRPRRQLTEAT